MRAIDFWVGSPDVLLHLIWRVQRFRGSPLHLSAHRATSCSFNSLKWGRWSSPTRTGKRARLFRMPHSTLCFTEIRSSVEMLEIVPSGTSSPSTRTHSCHSRDSLLFPWRARRRRIDTVINTEASSVRSVMAICLARAGSRLTGSTRRIYWRFVDPQSALQRANPRRAHLSRPRPRTRSPCRPRASNDQGDGLPRRSRIATDAGRLRDLAKLRAIAPDIGPQKLVVVNPNASAVFRCPDAP